MDMKAKKANREKKPPSGKLKKHGPPKKDMSPPKAPLTATVKDKLDHSSFPQRSKTNVRTP